MHTSGSGYSTICGVTAGLSVCPHALNERAIKLTGGCKLMTFQAFLPKGCQWDPITKPPLSICLSVCLSISGLYVSHEP
ncbi:hypothetical protein EVAR_31196_1 [Eumeta japonica]|uniref:Uncharacterized protein n=1 Tax=Eumeta variegata TaxID=151549 RepID=A0A4C1VY98_EUMVA|nr:hypothetical protein EVAR_31196_1 [Eumeta japonica]